MHVAKNRGGSILEVKLQTNLVMDEVTRWPILRTHTYIPLISTFLIQKRSANWPGVHGQAQAKETGTERLAFSLKFHVILPMKSD